MTIYNAMVKKLRISKTLNELLDKNNLTLRKLSKESGVPVSTLSEYKKNNRNPNAEDLAKVADALDCSIHYLLFGLEDPSEPIQKVLKQEFFKGTFEITLKRVRLEGEE